MAKFTICLTHDVDRVRKTYQYISQDVRHIRVNNLLSIVKKGNPYWCFDKIMNLEDSYGVRSTFFFLEESIKARLLSPKSWKLALGRYSVREKEVSAIIRELHDNGWEIGLHGSYNSYRDGKLMMEEKKVLEDVLGSEVIGIRQHYLNLDIPATWKKQKEAGFKYDASYGKNSGIGWLNSRYQPFIDEESGMYVIPLALMECYLFSEAGRDIDKVWKLTKELMDKAAKNKAVFVVLWHQRLFNENEFPGYLEIYRRIIQEGIERGAQFMTCGEIYNKGIINVEV